MAADDELRKVRKSLARGRSDEALLYLWNALEPARLEGGAALREVEQLAARIRAQGDENQAHEAERLLAAARGGSSAAEAPEARPQAWSPAERAEQQAQAEPAPAEAAEPAAEGEPEPVPRRSGLLRFVLPAIFILIVLVNVLSRAFGD